MLHRLWLTCGLVLTGILATYAVSTREPRADFTFVNASEIHTLDPARMSWTTDFRMALNIWDGLTSWDPQTLLPVGGCTEFPPVVSEDGLIYSFTIRADARWSNGDPVTAADFVRGWRRGLEPGTATDYTFLLTNHIAGAEDHVTWRRQSASALTALVRLRDGWGIDETGAGALSRSPDVRAGLAALPASATAALNDAMHKPDWPRAAGEFSRLSLDWNSLHEQVFRNHAEQLESRFDQVGLSAIDDKTFRVTLLRPCSYFLDLTGMPIFLPCHESIELLRERYRGAPITETGLVIYDPQWTKPNYHAHGYPGLITNGPYKLHDWVFKRRARLTVNPFHSDASRLHCRTIDMLVFDNLNAALMAYEAGYVDLLPELGVPYAHEIARLSVSGERPDFHTCPVLATYFLNFNCRSEFIGADANPFRDRRVRKALSLTIDKPSIVENVRGRGDRPAVSFIPPDGIPGYTPPAGLDRDVSQAKSLLAEAGFPDGAGLPPIKLLYTANDEHVCQAIARTWEQDLGIRVELQIKESKTFAEDKAERRFMVARGKWYADYNDPTTFLDCLLTDNGNNDSGYSNPAYDALLARAEQTRDASQRLSLLAQAERIIVDEDFPIVPILHFAEPIAVKPYVRGIHPNPRLWFPLRSIRLER